MMSLPPPRHRRWTRGSSSRPAGASQSPCSASCSQWSGTFAPRTLRRRSQRVRVVPAAASGTCGSGASRLPSPQPGVVRLAMRANDTRPELPTALRLTVIATHASHCSQETRRCSAHRTRRTSMRSTARMGRQTTTTSTVAALPSAAARCMCGHSRLSSQEYHLRCSSLLHHGDKQDSQTVPSQCYFIGRLCAVLVCVFGLG